MEQFPIALIDMQPKFKYFCEAFALTFFSFSNLWQRLHTELDFWINWFRHPQLMQSAPPGPQIQELQLLLHEFWQKSKKSKKKPVF